MAVNTAVMRMKTLAIPILLIHDVSTKTRIIGSRFFAKVTATRQSQTSCADISCQYYQRRKKEPLGSHTSV